MKIKKIAFVVGIFPAVSETFIIDQVAALLDKGIDVKIFSFQRGRLKNISEKYCHYHMPNRTKYLEMPRSRFVRLIRAVPLALRLLVLNPLALFHALNVKKYGPAAHSLRYLFWSAPFAGEQFDLVHAHFGVAADDFLIVKDILGLECKLVTSFYGFDVSRIVREYGPKVYDRLKREGDLFLVMSEDMKKRVVALGFNPAKVIIHPVGIRPDDYEFKERILKSGERVEIISVGRFVEKKGFDDLLQALAIVKQKIGNKFRCAVIGDGPLHEHLHQLADSLGVNDVIEWKGFMPIEKITNLFGRMHFFVQPSKTAANGDME